MKLPTKFHFRLRTKLTLLLLLTAAVPLLIASGVVITQTQNAERQSALALTTQVGSTAAVQIQDFIESQFGILDDIGRIFETTSIADAPKSEASTHLLERFLYGNTYFYDLTLVDATGQEIIRENRQQAFSASQLTSRATAPEFKAVQTDGYYVGPEFLINGRSYFILGRAIYNLNHTLIGATFVQIDGRLLQEVVQTISELYRGERVYMIDRNRYIIAHPDISQVLGARKATYLPSSIFSANANHEYINDLGQSVIGTAIPVALSLETNSNMPLVTNWDVIAEQQSSVALAPVEAITTFSVWILVIAILGITGISFFSSRKVVRPIEMMHEVAQAYGAGKLDKRVAIESKDEIGDLASGFNTMAGRLSDSIAALREDRERIASIIANLSDGLIEYDKNNTILLINPTAARLLGVEPDTVLDKRFSAQDPQQTDLSLPIGEQNLQKVFSLSHTTQPLEDYFDSRESVISLIEGEITPTNELRLEIHKPFRRNLSITSLSYVVTSGEKREERFLKIIHDVTRDHIISRMKSEFISIAAHQLRTPLTEIKWALRSVLDGDLGKLNIKQQDLVDKAYAMNNQLVHLVGDLLNVTRIEEGRFAYVFKEGDLVALVQKIIKNLALRFEEKRITLSLAPVPPLPLCFFDSDKIEIAFSNIIENALNYTPPGGTITVEVLQEGDFAHIRVSDTGVGIPREDIPRIFTKFFRANNAIKLQTQGSGLGLFMVKHIIETHGGKISIQSTEGEGTTVDFTLPLKRDHTPAPSLADSSSSEFTPSPLN